MTEATPPAHIVTQDNWLALQRHTAARIALGRSGSSLPTRALLDFDVAHAQARDAVLTPLDVPALCEQLQQAGWPCLTVHSRAADRHAYLARPDWGRRLHADSASLLAAQSRDPIDLVFVVSDGLSSTAIQRHAVPLLGALRPLLASYRLAPLVIATQARVALADEVGELLGARLSISLIGERPGLSSPDSLGIYLTHGPRLGRTDAERNCISNVRPEGLAYADAAQHLGALVHAALHAGLSGVALRFDPRTIGQDS